MALVEIKLHVAYALLQSDWLVQNLELVPGNPGTSSSHTYISFPPPAHLRTRMRIRGKISLVRETSVRACVFVCVCLRACLGELPLACVRVFHNLFCVCFRMSVSENIFFHALKHALTDEHTLTLMHTFTLARTGVNVRACLCTSVCAWVCVCMCVFLIG